MGCKYVKDFEFPRANGGMIPVRGYMRGGKVGRVMGEFKEGRLHSGSKTGPKVTDRKQAVAIAMSEARKK